MSRKKDLEFIKHVAKDIDALGGQVFYVGGCVRDEILGKPCNDVDIEVYKIKPDILSEVLSKYGTQEIVGNAFGVFNVHGYDVDISLPRKDNKSGLKHTDFDIVVDPFMSFEDATSRRDFTMNAIMKNVITGEYVDVQNGISDLKNKIIRHVSDEHFAEDPLRVLRAARFASQLEFNIAEETKEICKTVDLKNLSAERILSETQKALSSKSPSIYFENLKELNQLNYWFKELNALIGIKQNPNYHIEADAFEHTMLVLDKGAENLASTENKEAFLFSCLCHDLGKATKTDPITFKSVGHEIDSIELSEKMLKRIKADNFTIKYVKELSAKHMDPGHLYNDLSSDKKIHAFLDKTDYPEDLLLLKKCDREGAIHGPKFTNKENLPYDVWAEQVLKKYHEWLKKPHLTGKDLLAAGMKQGIEVGQILERQRNLEYSNSFEDALSLVKKEFNIPDETYSKILKAKNIKKEFRSEKILKRYQECGYCINLDVKNLSPKQVILKADEEIMKDFSKTKRSADEYYDFLKEKLKDKALGHQLFLDNLEKNKDRKI